MSVGRFGRSAEPETLVRLGELHVEERHQRLDEVVPTHLHITTKTVFNRFKSLRQVLKNDLFIFNFVKQEYTHSFPAFCLPTFRSMFRWRAWYDVQ